ncbi:MAG: MaoC family dehydratase [Firmicutes bacterium]|nr:MaoC family dehydratase [Bacillota bacterium]
MSYTIDQLTVGQSSSFSKTVTETDVYMFAGVSGDFNPAHVNSEFAAKTPFKQRIAHGMLSASFVSTEIGTDLPGPGTIYLEQKMKFTNPVYIGDTITAKIEVKELIKEKNRAVLTTTCTKQDGTVVLVGEAVVMPPR